MSNFILLVVEIKRCGRLINPMLIVIVKYKLLGAKWGQKEFIWGQKQPKGGQRCLQIFNY